ncbi:hypothetical protein ABZU46_12125, partial [Micromonospora sp. NPDC005197]
MSRTSSGRAGSRRAGAAALVLVAALTAAGCRDERAEPRGGSLAPSRPPPASNPVGEGHPAPLKQNRKE